MVTGVKYWILLGMQVSGRMLAWRVLGPEFKPQVWNNNKQGMGGGAEYENGFHILGYARMQKI